MSVLLGVFAPILLSFRPLGIWIWTWPIVSQGQFLIALIFADLASRVPLTGSIYYWNKKTRRLDIRWQAGWIMIFAISVGGVSAILALKCRRYNRFSASLLRPRGSYCRSRYSSLSASCEHLWRPFRGSNE